VIRLTVKPDAGMHGPELCSQNDRRWLFQLPVTAFGGNGSAPERPPDIHSDWNRHLATAFRSPRTTARFRTAILGSKFPAYCFDTLLTVNRAVRLTATSLSPVSPGSGEISTADPFPASCSTTPAALRISTPLWGLLDPSGSKRSTRLLTGRLASRKCANGSK